MLVVFLDIFVIKLVSYGLKDHTFILHTPESTTPFLAVNKGINTITELRAILQRESQNS